MVLALVQWYRLWCHGAGYPWCNGASLLWCSCASSGALVLASPEHQTTMETNHLQLHIVVSGGQIYIYFEEHNILPFRTVEGRKVKLSIVQVLSKAI